MDSVGRRRSTRLSQSIPERKSTRIIRKSYKVISDNDEDEECENLNNKDVKFAPPTPRKTRLNDSYASVDVTPPKLRKTPQKEHKTPPVTPTALLGQLSIRTPKSSRKSLFPDLKENTDEANDDSIKTKTPKKNTSNEENISPERREFKGNCYQNARKALHSTFPTAMPGRETEIETLRTFIQQHINDKSSGTMYISGPPGTGKTATLNLLLESEDIQHNIKKVYVNCTSIKSSGAIFARIVKDLGVKVAGKAEKDYVSAIEKHLRNAKSAILLVLDEIDQLESKNQSVLYRIFEWPSNPNYHLILVGIANALDLTDRLLPRLQARCELKPQLMHFASYTKQQIIEIFTSRLKEANMLEVFSPVALQVLAAKVAAISGDVRRALDIGRRVVALIDQKKSIQNVLQAIENMDESESSTKLDPVNVTEVVTVLKDVYGASQNLSEQVNEAFPLVQKIIVCSLLLVLKHGKSKDVTLGRLHDVCRKVCTKRNIQVMDQGEFVGLCALIETRGILRVIKKKESRLSKICLVWDEEDVITALKDKQLISMILQDVSCLSK